MKYITGEFEAVALDCDETLPEGIIPMDASSVLAERKAAAAAEKFPDYIVIGCDTTVIADGNILGKPHDRAECLHFMEMLSGSTHYVVTSCCLYFKGRKECFSSVTDVTFRQLSQAEIEAYADTDEPYDKAGGYGIQGLAGDFIDSVDGDFFNVVGLPVAQLFNELKNFLRKIKGELL